MSDRLPRCYDELVELLAVLRQRDPLAAETIDTEWEKALDDSTWDDDDSGYRRRIAELTDRTRLIAGAHL